MLTLRRIASIIVLLLALAFGPVLISGYAELSLAESSAAAHDRSIHYELAAQRLPDFLSRSRPGLYELAGLAAVQAAEYARAITLFHNADQKGTLTPNGRLKLGQAYFFAGAEEKAIAEWQSLLNDSQVRGSASQALASVYHARSQFDTEHQVLRQWLEFDPASPDAQYGLGLLLFADASPAALPLLESAASSSPTLKPHIDGLISALKTALDKPAGAGRLTLCGQTLAAIGQWPLAEWTFQRAVQADPYNGLAWAWLGEARQQTGSADAAAAFQQALTFSPDSAAVRAMVGLYWQRQRDWQKALAEFNEAARLEPRNAVWQMSLGDVYVHLGNLIQALDHYQSAVGLAPQDPQAWRALALFSVENDVDVEGTGRAAALQAYALEPGSPQNMDILGRTLLATEQWDAAEAIFKKAIAAAPTDAAPLFHLALLYLQSGKPDLAKQYLQSAQALDPGGPIGTQAAKVLARYFP